MRAIGYAAAVGMWGALIVPAALAAVREVEVGNNYFRPKDLAVAPGDTVRWVWKQGSHTATSGTNCTYDKKYFDAVLNSTNKTFEWVVPDDAPSVINYYCKPHCSQGQRGTIQVKGSNLQATLDGWQEVPVSDTPATGSGTFFLDRFGKKLTWNIEFSGLTSEESAAHIHGSARPCAEAGVQIDLGKGNPKSGTKTITDAQIKMLESGLCYVNIHSANFPDGEIRGQIVPLALNNPIEEEIRQGHFRLNLQPIATGLAAPNWGYAPAGDTGRLFVSDQNGILWNINLESGEKSVFFDVSGRLVSLGIFGPDTFDERGLIGFAFHPDYANNGLLYTFTSEPIDGAADFTTIPEGEVADCQSVIAEWTVPNPGDPASTPDPNSRRELIRIDKPQFNHNGGNLLFGPDNLLYIAVGDGGGADDADGTPWFPNEDDIVFGHGCGGNGADRNVILGKILRIDPQGNNSTNGKYGIPADNPYVGGGGLGEIFASGFRNPWRFSFDTNGDFYVADVGQNAIEELDLVIKGGDYGWRWKEGSFYFVNNGTQSGYITDHALDVPAGLIDPIAEYDHDEGLSIIGGFVYRGTAIPNLVGHYVFGDFARTFNNDGRLFILHEDGDNLMIEEARLVGQEALGYSLLGFGEDRLGRIYALANLTGVPFGETGVVLRIGPGYGDMNCDGQVDFDDIDGFVLALTNQADYESAYPNCAYLQGDIDDNASVDFDDIDPFVECLLNGGCP